LSQEPRLLKKHANRRLYDTARKHYVSLDQIRELICDGVDIRVEDSQSGEDITRPILLQIMAECERNGRPMLSPQMLTSLIRHYGHPLQDLVGPYLEESLVFYTRQEARVRKALSSFTHLDGRENIAAMRRRFAKILGVGRPDRDATED
jgi:polyhydroxyalkanoate synthesis repressor PhaR